MGLRDCLGFLRRSNEFEISRPNRPAAMSPPRAEDAPLRRQEILAVALELLAEEGYAGASLRKLAARLGIAQPSLYHYFATKEDLVEQVLATYGGQMYEAANLDAMPSRLVDMPRYIADTTLRVYERPAHALFVRVAISVSRTHPRFGTLMRRVFVEQPVWGIQQIMRPFIQAGVSQIPAQSWAMEPARSW